MLLLFGVLADLMYAKQERSLRSQSGLDQDYYGFESNPEGSVELLLEAFYLFHGSILVLSMDYRPGK